METDQILNKTRVVIDTNVFISSFFNKQGNPRKIIDLWKTDKIILCISAAILSEYMEVLIRLELYNEPELNELLDLFKKHINISAYSKLIHIEIIKEDFEDNMFLECAIANKAKYIISGDKHLLNLKEFQGIKILTPVEFIMLYK